MGRTRRARNGERRPSQAEPAGSFERSSLRSPCLSVGLGLGLHLRRLAAHSVWASVLCIVTAWYGVLCAHCMLPPAM